MSRYRFSRRYDTAGAVVVSHTQEHLAACLASVLAQTEPFDRIVLVDNASPSDRQALDIGCHHGIEVVRTEQPVSLAAARNLGIACLHDCDVIVTFDGDDLMEPEYLAVYRATALETNAQVVFGAATLFGAAQGVWFTAADRGRRPNLRRGNFVPANSLFTRELWETVGGFDPDQHVFEDWDFWLSGAAVGARFQPVDQPLWRYRRHAASMLSTSTIASKEAARRRIWSKHLDYMRGPLQWRRGLRRIQRLREPRTAIATSDHRRDSVAA